MKKPTTQQQSLKQPQYEISAKLTDIVTQLERQADSTFDGAPWSKVGLAGFGDRLIEYGKALISLGDNYNSGTLPQWWLDQQAAYETSAIGQLARRKRL